MKDFSLDEKILIIDKQGAIGRKLCSGLMANNIKTLIFSSEMNSFSKEERIYFIPLSKKPFSVPKDDYGEIIIVYSGEKEILEILTSLLRETEDLKTRIFLVLPLKLLTAGLIENAGNFEGLNLVFLGEIFGEGFDEKNITNDLFNQAKRGKVNLKGYGTEKIYPVFLDDAIKAILGIIVKKKLNSKIFYAFSNTPITELSLVRAIKKADPLLAIDFLEEGKREKKDFVLPKGEFLIEESTPEEKIKRVFLEKKDREKENNNFREPLPKNKRNFFFRKLLFSFFLILILPIFGFTIFSFLGAYQLKLSGQSLLSADFLKAKKTLENSRVFFNTSQTFFNILLFGSDLLGGKDFLIKTANFYNEAREISAMLNEAVGGADEIKKVMQGKSAVPRENLTSGLNLLKNSLLTYQEIQLKGNSLKSEIKLKEADQLTTSLNYFEALPYILGMDKPKKYLVLFQNNMELRPGGGFIGSFAILNVDKGKIGEFNIQNVYDADGQLKGHVEPPFPIRRYLPQAHWFLRDSNFSMDFTKNASSAAFFLKQEKGEIVDGVIAVDASFLRDIIKVLGKVYVLDYKETVTADNFYTLTQKYAEKNSFAGSSQKKDFLRSLYVSLKAELSAPKNISYLKLGNTVLDSIEKKHLLFAFSDSSLKNLFLINKMSSSPFDLREDNRETVNDFLSVSEANLGVNKINNFIKRKVEQRVSIGSAGQIEENVILYYKNNSNGREGGDYKNYIRLAVPFGSNLKSISIDGKDQKLVPAVTDFKIYESKSFKPSKDLEVEKTEEEGKSVFGFLTVISSKSLKTIKIFYTIPGKFSIASLTPGYNLIVFKQPGTEEDDIYSFNFNYPSSFKTFNLSKEFSDKNNQLKLERKLDKDLEINVNFSKK